MTEFIVVAYGKIAIVLFCMAISVDASAYDLMYTCPDGRSVTVPLTEPIDLLVCTSGLDLRSRESFWRDVTAAAFAWNSAPGLLSMVNVYEDSTCARPKDLDGKSHIALASSAEWPDDEMVPEMVGGVTHRHWECPPSGEGIFREADIYINSTPLNPQIPGSTLPCSSSQLSRQSIIAHEIGHAIGMRHEDHVPSLLAKEKPSIIRFCGYPSVTPLPDDLRGARTLYTSGVFAEDIAAAATVWVSPAPKTPDVSSSRPTNNTHGGNVFACKGKSITYEYSVAHLGNVSSLFDVEFILSQDNVVGNSDDVSLGTLQNPPLWFVFPSFLTQTINLAVPKDARLVPGKTYRVGHRVDPRNQISEWHETNNSGLAGGFVVVKDANDPACM